jgi:gliding motility-associated transport system permease protein
VRTALAIARKELEVYATTPIAWVALMVVFFFSALFFNGALDAYRDYTLRALTLQNPEALEQLNLTDLVLFPVFGSAGVLVMIVAPFLTMRLVAEEKRQRTFELLFTTPVRPIQIVLGKYLGGLVMLGGALLLLALFPALLAAAGRGASGGASVEWRTVATGLLGLLLLAGMATAIGLFFSAVTESVVVAALLGEIVLLALWLVGLLAMYAQGPLKEIAAGVSATEHLRSFLQGKVELKDVVYFLSFAALGLYLTDRAVEAQRWA